MAPRVWLMSVQGVGQGLHLILERRPGGARMARGLSSTSMASVYGSNFTEKGALDAGVAPAGEGGQPAGTFSH